MQKNISKNIKMNLKLKHPNKPISCLWIDLKIWETLNLKEKDLIILLYEKKYTRLQICRKLYIETDQGYRYLCKKLKKKLNL